MAVDPDIGPFHDEVQQALQASAPGGDVGERIRLDRGSSIEHLGLRTPERRKLVKAGFSFYDRGDEGVLRIWDGIWWSARWADVMFAALDYYREQLKTGAPPGFWSVGGRWITRVDNWAHADDLARVYSWALAWSHDEVYRSLVDWNRSDDEWHRRISIVSLIHYSGKGAVFLAPEMVLPLIRHCLADSRPGIQKAVGWVLRETAAVHHDETVEFLKHNRDDISAVALRRATERLEPALRSALRES